MRGQTFHKINALLWLIRGQARGGKPTPPNRATRKALEGDRLARAGYLIHRHERRTAARQP
jgi:hypothetical protein